MEEGGRASAAHIQQKRDKSTTLIRILPLFGLVRTEYNIKREWARTIDNSEAPSIWRARALVAGLFSVVLCHYLASLSEILTSRFVFFLQ